jgi:hypothetical protein
MSDREQTRRDAEAIAVDGIETMVGPRYLTSAQQIAMATDYLALLAELEQAERERDELRKALDERGPRMSL